MKRLWASVRVRLLVASVMWTAGLLYVAHLTSVYFFVGPGAFDRMHRIGLVLTLAIGLMIAGAHVFRQALARFMELRRRLIDVREGRERAIAGEYLNEIQPLVDDLNALLHHQDRRVRDAVAKAGDLAHGLKTPLAVLTQEADRLARGGQHDAAATVAQQVERMRRQVDYHLAHARAAASGATPGARCPVAESAQGIVRTLERLYDERRLAIAVDVPADHVVRGQREDLDEMLGNLLDNACKWAASRVSVTSHNGGGRIAISVDDDGPGIRPAMRTAVLQRGVRADEALPGSGLGLAIVRDLVEVYGGSVRLDTSPLGGLRATIELPQA